MKKVHLRGDSQARPSAAREGAYARSPKEALAVDLYLLVKNLHIILGSVDPTNEKKSSATVHENPRVCRLADLTRYTILNHAEVKAGAVDGIGETYRPQRQQLLKELYSAVQHRSKVLPTAANSGMLARVLGSTFNASALTSAVEAGSAQNCADDDMAMCSPMEAALSLQAAQLLCDLLQIYHPSASHFGPDEQRLKQEMDIAPAPLYVQVQKAKQQQQQQQREEEERLAQIMLPEQEQKSSRSSSPSRSRHGSPSARYKSKNDNTSNASTQGDAFTGGNTSSRSRPNPPSLLKRVEAFALPSHHTLAVIDLTCVHLRQVRVCLLVSLRACIYACVCVC